MDLSSEEALERIISGFKELHPNREADLEIEHLLNTSRGSSELDFTSSDEEALNDKNSPPVVRRREESTGGRKSPVLTSPTTAMRSFPRRAISEGILRAVRQDVSARSSG